MTLVDKVMVKLNDGQREALRRIVRTGKHPARLLCRAHTLLKMDANGFDGWTDEQIA